MPTPALMQSLRLTSSVMPTEVGIQAIYEISTASRGWQAFARHDDERLAALVKRLGYFTTSPNRCLSK
jgi:hypothetical protein